MKRAILTLATMIIAMPLFALDVGDMAPDFSLQGTDGETHTLAQYRGKSAVVIAWFPKAYTRGCTIECKSLAEHGDLIKEYQVSYFMASVDPLDDNKGFAKEQKADFPLLSDPTKTTAKAYGVLADKGYALRQTFYIGKDGKILAIDKAVNPATSAQDMATKLGELGIEASTKKPPGANSFSFGPVIEGYGENAPVKGMTPIKKGQAFKVAFDVGAQNEDDSFNRKFNTLARFINAHVANGVNKKDIHLALVVHGKASFDLLNNAARAKKEQTDNPNKDLLAQLMANQVKVSLCGQTAAFYGISKEDLLPGVELSLSAMTSHALLQQAGYSLNPF